MSTFLSPGVYVTEKDMSAIAPNIANNVAFFAGTFNAGPVGLPYVITNKVELEKVFGTPDDQNYNEFFQAWKYLDYANQLIVTRAYDETPFTNPNYKPTLSSDPEFVGTYEDFVFDPNLSAGSFDLSLGVNSNIKLPKFGIGDYITIGTDGSGSSSTATLWKVSSLTPNTNLGSMNPEKLSMITVNVEPALGSGGAGGPAKVQEGPIYLHTKGYLNGETQAFQRQMDINGAIPANAMDPANIDHLGATSTFSQTRLGMKYTLIKNEDEWDFLYTKDANPLRSGWIESASSTVKGKLKFFTRTPTAEPVEVRIANYEDFIYETSSDGAPINEAVAFEEQVEDRIQVTTLTDLFQYYPNKDQIALIFKKGNEIETFVVGFDPKGVDGNNKSNYIETVVNETSNLVYVLENTQINDLPATYLVCDRFGREWDEATKKWNPKPGGVETTGLTVQGGKTPRVSIGGLREAYFSVEDKERYEIDVIIANELENSIAVDLAEKRKDCIAYVGANHQDVVGRKAFDATNRIIGYITENDDNKRAQARWGTKLTRSMFAAFFGNYFRIYDNYNKKYRWINVAGDMAGIRCEITTTNASWWVSAGLKRGIIRGIDRMGFTPSEPMRDNLYKNSINPLVTFPGTGHLVWGNKTLQSYASAFDRINVRSMFNTIERSMSKSAKSQVFEFNDPFTRNAMLSMFNPYLAAVKAGRGIIDFLVVCDETNNNPEVLKTPHELRVDIYIKPNYAAEFIQLNFVNVGTRSFVEVIGA